MYLALWYIRIVHDKPQGLHIVLYFFFRSFPFCPDVWLEKHCAKFVLAVIGKPDHFVRDITKEEIMGFNPDKEVSKIVAGVIEIIQLDNKILIPCKNLILPSFIEIFQRQVAEVYPQLRIVANSFSLAICLLL